MREQDNALLAQPSKVDNQIDNLAIYTTALPHKQGDELWVAMIVACEVAKGEVKDVSAALPELWKSKYTTHLLPISTIFDGEVALQNDITHIALLQSVDQKTLDGDPFLFGADWVMNDAVMLQYAASTGRYYYFHCRKCCYIVLTHMIEQQDAWKRQAGGNWRVGNTLN